MVTKEEEIEAREICALTNGHKYCIECCRNNTKTFFEYEEMRSKCEHWKLWLSSYNKPLKVKLVELKDKILNGIRKCLSWMNI